MSKVSGLPFGQKSSNVYNPDCNIVVVLKRCEPELFHIFLKESYFPDFWKVSSLVPAFKNVGESSRAKKTAAQLVFFLS